ncbi:DUF3267 domain-containing protein [Natronorubrum sp. JWXQ-INN-674]|uniref:DUF3267 domain-containing protein n=1 Tax=Natronorubrum halalkaliphilum TaxID=2691917 RepID=A0A6B0VQS3_9EURY|nr:DUF3267 domain-containing protein [Natronorubrum halalkaliphilum]MXV64151.1 DUF3267 domain-containing protein [Natronorubrum halalkaliphilum]
MSRPSPRESPTPQLVATVRRTRATALRWLVVAVVGFVAAAYAFGHVLAVLLGGTLEPILVPVFGPTDALVWLVVAAGLVALVVVPHELLHGVVMARYGGTPSYGVGVAYFVLPYAYAETERVSYTRNQLLVALLAPFVTITTVGLAAMIVYPSPLLIVPLAANAAGSIGDLWMAGVLLQYPREGRVGPLPADDAQGFGIYADGSSAGDVRRRPGMRALSRFVSGAVGTFAVLTITLVGAVFASLAVGSGTVVIGDPDGWLLFRHELDPHGGTVFLEVGASLLAGVAVVGGVAWALLAEGARALVRP